MSSRPLAGKVALITGGSKGIGAATALRLARDGARIVINYSSDSTAADAIVAQIGPDHALAIKADAGNVAELDRLVSETVARFGKIDILIPNAAVAPMKDLENTTEAEFDATLAVNVKGPYFLIQKALPHLPASSRVILLSTTLCAASTVTPTYLLYLTSKGAIEQMVRVLAKDLGRRQICVNAVAPGATSTELFLRGKPEGLIKAIGNMNPNGRLGAPEEIADVIAFLSGEGGRWVNGQVVRVNGGMA